MPAEWQPHAATLLAWPHQTSDWPGRFAPIPWVYAEIVRRLAPSEPVLLVVPPGAERRVNSMLRKSGVDLARVELLTQPTDRVWVRDSGPIGVLDTNGQRVQLDWHFNGWAKYENWQADAAVPRAVAEHLGDPVIRVEHAGRHVVLEGGSIDVNGQGLILTTEECLLSEMQCRNPGFTATDYERLFAECFGATQTIWLGRGIAGDDTHGHVDDLARFVNLTTVVTVVEGNAADENYRPLQENLDRLRGVTGLDVVTLPMPEPVVFRKQRLPASYANFYVGNTVVLVPTFNDPADRVALGTLADLFPGRTVCGIHAVELVWGLGTLHCLSQQIPLG